MSVADKLRKEEAELERLAGYTGSDEKPSEEEIEAPSTEEELEESGGTDEMPLESVETTITQESPKDTSEKPKEDLRKVSWKKRFANYKATTDTTIFKLRAETADLKASLANVLEQRDDLSKKYFDLQTKQKASVDKYADIFSTEDEEIVGPEAIAIFKKALNAKEDAPSSEVDSLKKELEDIKTERIAKLRREQENQQQTSFEDLKNSLTSLVPDWQEIDEAPEFGTYINGMDSISGRPRKDLYKVAIDARDAYSVARFYTEYASLKPASKRDILAKKVGPVTSGAGDPASILVEKKDTYTINEYVNFYEDLNKGKYKGKEKEAKVLQHKLDTAYVNGQLTD